MSPTQIFKMAAAAYKNHQPFVIYSHFSSNLIEASFQNSDQLFVSKSLTENGFVLAPFNYEGNAPIMPFSESDNFSAEIINEEKFLPKTANFEATEVEKSTHINLVEAAVNAINSTENSKIVISRKKEILLKVFEIEKLLELLFSVHANAFRYCWYHPKTNLWCGATPEVLLKINNDSFETMSLAGTQKASKEEIVWGQKEIDEQLLVTKTVVENLQNIISHVEISKPYNQIAGNMVHIRTDISGKLKKGKNSLEDLVKAIHPTPAICGVSRLFAKNFILQNENYKREFYTGFLGVINSFENKTNLYVNLRCMKIENNITTIYAGGGITAASIPKDEWEETQNKLQTMSQLIHEFL